MNKMNQKRVKTLIKDNAIVNKAIELMDMERSNQNNAVQSFYRTAKAMEKADEYLKSKEFQTELKNAEVKDYNKKEIVPLIFGVSYVKFARELQVAKLTQKQVNDFVKAVQKDDKMSVSKQGLLSFVKGKKQVKTETAKAKTTPTKEGGQEETKNGGQESNIIFGCHFNPFGLVEAKGSLKITKGGIENSDKLSAEQLMDIRNSLKFAEAQVEKLLSTKVVKRVKK